MARAVWLRLVALMLCMAPWSAHAGVFRCEHTTLTQADEQRLMVRVEASLPQGAALDPAESRSCRAQNWASAFLQTQRVRSAEDTAEWWSVHCSRDEGTQWSCDPVEGGREGSVNVPIDGVERTVTLQFDRLLSPALARRLAIRAFTLRDDAGAWPRACTPAPGRPDSEDDWIAVKARNRIAVSEPELRSNVSRSKDGIEVDLISGSLAIRFQLGGRDATSIVSECWCEYVIIT